MDKNQKYGFVTQTEEYMEQKKVLDLFQSLTKQLLIHRPDSPLDFLIERIGKKEPIRIFLVGPPGSIAKMLARRVSKEMDFTTISVGEVMRKEAIKTTDMGKEIAECIKNYRYIPDETLSYVIKTHILKCENDNKNWILEGFPRTKAQALSLQKIGVIPDKFILLNADRETSVEKIKKSMVEEGTSFVGEGLEHAAEIAYSEYELHVGGVRECYEQFIYEAHVNKPMDEMEKDLLTMIRIKVANPMRPPRIIVLGPAGSGRGTQSRLISKKYGIVHVSVVDLMMHEMAKKTTRGKIITECMKKGELVPNIIVISLVEHRLKQSDCYVNGWVMDGFPKTIEQVTLLTQMKINSTKVIILECKQDVCIERLSMKRIDPVTGFLYNLADSLPENEAIIARLIQIDGNDEETVKKRWYSWDEFVGKIEEVFSD